MKTNATTTTPDESGSQPARTGGHTPGPWKTDSKQVDGAISISAKAGYRLADVYAQNNYDYAANARLIASAPDLLAAAMKALNHIDANTGELRMWKTEPALAKQLRAAITKAQGGE